MKLNEIDKKLKKLKIDEESKEAFLELMDSKIETDMKEVILEMKGLKNELNTKVDGIKWTVTIGIAIATAIIAGINIALKFFSN